MFKDEKIFSWKMYLFFEKYFAVTIVPKKLHFMSDILELSGFQACKFISHCYTVRQPALIS